MYNNLKVISSIWYGIKIPIFSNRLIGIVAAKNEITQKIKLYIGIGKGDTEKEDENHVLQYGVPFYPGFLIDWLTEIICHIEE